VGRSTMRAWPGGAGRGRPALESRIETTSAARNRPKATARSNAAMTGAVPWIASSPASWFRSRARPVMRWAAAPLMNASAAGPRAQNACSAGFLGRTARAGAGLGPP
jgi:hypothetical protein